MKKKINKNNKKLNKIVKNALYMNLKQMFFRILQDIDSIKLDIEISKSENNMREIKLDNHIVNLTFTNLKEIIYITNLKKDFSCFELIVDKDIIKIFENQFKVFQDLKINLSEFIRNEQYIVYKIEDKQLQILFSFYLYIILYFFFEDQIQNKQISYVTRDKEGQFKLLYKDIELINENQIKGINDKEELFAKLNANINIRNFTQKFMNLLDDIENILKEDMYKQEEKESNKFIKVKDSCLITLNQTLNTQYPFVAIEEYCKLEDKVKLIVKISEFKLEDIINKRKYALAKNGAIIDFVKKDKAVDNVEVYETEEWYYFKVKYIISENSVNKLTIDGKIPLRENIITSLKLKKEKLDNCINYTINSELDMLVNCFIEIDNITCTLDNYVKNDIITTKQLKLNEQHKIKQAIMLLHCLYVVFCDINNKEVKLYQREVNRNHGNKRGKIAYRTAYIRRLPDTWKASIEAKEKAKKMGIKLEEGYTFVSEVTTGKEDKRIIKVKDY